MIEKVNRKVGGRRHKIDFNLKTGFMIFMVLARGAFLSVRPYLMALKLLQDLEGGGGDY